MRIGIVAPAREITQETASRVAAVAALWFPDADLVFHPQCFASAGHFAGPDALRARAFLDVANDASFDALWCARGGYGSNRIVPQILAGLAPAARAKSYLGYSDMGFLLGALYARRIGRPAHGPMPIDIGRAGGDRAVVRALGWLAARDPASLEPALGAEPAAAFNLAILTSLLGTPWLPDLTDHVLLIEDVSEPLYRIDRMLWQMTNATQLKGIAAVRLGAITDIQANDPPWGGDPENMVRDWCAVMGIPYRGRAQIGHVVDNFVVPFGVA